MFGSVHRVNAWCRKQRGDLSAHIVRSQGHVRTPIGRRDTGIDSESTGGGLHPSCVRGIGNDRRRRPIQVGHDRCDHTQRPDGVGAGIEGDHIGRGNPFDPQCSAGGRMGAWRAGHHHYGRHAFAIQRGGVLDPGNACGLRITPDPTRIQHHDRLGGRSVVELRGQDHLDRGAHRYQQGDDDHHGQDQRADRPGGEAPSRPCRRRSELPRRYGCPSAQHELERRTGKPRRNRHTSHTRFRCATPAAIGQRLSLPWPPAFSIAERPASSRATGTRNGEHET